MNSAMLSKAASMMGRKGGSNTAKRMTKKALVERARKAGLASGLARWRRSLKVGDSVCVDGEKVVRLEAIWVDGQVAVHPPISTLRYWNINDLTPPMLKQKAGKR